jgi:low temperature requirement protein LtrA
VRASLRRSAAASWVTNVELFFDLVYAFAVTQLSHFLLDHATFAGVLAARLLGLVWLAWIYTPSASWAGSRRHC